MGRRLGSVVLGSGQVCARWEGRVLELTRVEFRLLDLLEKILWAGITRQQIRNAISDDGRYVSDRSIDSHVANLRRKLVAIVSTDTPVKPVYGVGYKRDF